MLYVEDSFIRTAGNTKFILNAKNSAEDVGSQTETIKYQLVVRFCAFSMTKSPKEPQVWISQVP